jgi:ribosomal protein L10
MKTKAQKQEDLKRGEALLGKSHTLVFVDMSGVKTTAARTLRSELKKGGNPLFVLKKRLLGLLLKQRGIEFDDRRFKTSVGTVFVSNLESAAAAVYRFFRGLELEKKGDPKKQILGGLDLGAKNFIEGSRVVMIGQLPPREVLLAQLAAMIAAPVRSLLYVLQERSKRS